jgi:hypothetical protein
VAFTLVCTALESYRYFGTGTFVQPTSLLSAGRWTLAIVLDSTVNYQLGIKPALTQGQPFAITGMSLTSSGCDYRAGDKCQAFSLCFRRRLRALKHANVPKKRLRLRLNHRWIDFAVRRMLVAFARKQREGKLGCGQDLCRGHVSMLRHTRVNACTNSAFPGPWLSCPDL